MRLSLPILLLAIVPAAVSAQQQTVALQMPVQVVGKLDVVPGAGSTVVDAGFAMHDGAVILRVTANVEWRVEVSAADGALEVRREGDGAYAAVSDGWQPLASGGRGRDQEIVLDLRRSGSVAPELDDLRVRIVTL